MQLIKSFSFYRTCNEFMQRVFLLRQSRMLHRFAAGIMGACHLPVRRSCRIWSGAVH